MNAAKLELLTILIDEGLNQINAQDVGDGDGMVEDATLCNDSVRGALLLRH